jgi:hypothetical protein
MLVIILVVTSIINNNNFINTNKCEKLIIYIYK